MTPRRLRKMPKLSNGRTQDFEAALAVPVTILHDVVPLIEATKDKQTKVPTVLRSIFLQARDRCTILNPERSSHQELPLDRTDCM